jgi:hypothetical protein
MFLALIYQDSLPFSNAGAAIASQHFRRSVFRGLFVLEGHY